MEQEKVYFVQVYFQDNPKIMRYLRSLSPALSEFVRIKSTIDTEKLYVSQNETIKVFKMAFIVLEEYQNYDLMNHLSSYISRIQFNQSEDVLSVFMSISDLRLIHYYDNEFLQTFVEALPQED